VRARFLHKVIIALGLFGIPLMALAQERGAPARIGVLWQLSPEDTPHVSALREGLREHGCAEGQNIALAADLVRLKVDVLVQS